MSLQMQQRSSSLLVSEVMGVRIPQTRPGSTTSAKQTTEVTKPTCCDEWSCMKILQVAMKVTTVSPSMEMLPVARRFYSSYSFLEPLFAPFKINFCGTGHSGFWPSAINKKIYSFAKGQKSDSCAGQCNCSRKGSDDHSAARTDHSPDSDCCAAAGRSCRSGTTWIPWCQGKSQWPVPQAPLKTNFLKFHLMSFLFIYNDPKFSLKFHSKCVTLANTSHSEPELSEFLAFSSTHLEPWCSHPGHFGWTTSIRWNIFCLATVSACPLGCPSPSTS